MPRRISPRTRSRRACAEIEVPLTLALIALLGVVFLRGFGEAIGIAVALVAAYLALNVVVIGNGLAQIVRQPHLAGHWRDALSHAYDSPLAMIGAAVLVFPKLALGLSGFETGVLVLPLVRGDAGDDPAHPAGRIRNGRKLITAAAAIMSVLLLASSVVTTLLIPQAAFHVGGPANGRALAYLAHHDLGDGFGTLYDISTIGILWFAGASAMAGLLNIVPRYLPRYGMAPDWTRATRPLVLLYTAICFAVTIFFRASVDAQAGAYATGVLALLTSASVAVTLSARRQGRTRAAAFFAVVSAIFLYTIGSTIRSQPEGLAIAAVFIAAIVGHLAGLARVPLDRAAGERRSCWTRRRAASSTRRAGARSGSSPTIRTIAARASICSRKREQRADNHIPSGEPVLFLEVTVADASEFAPIAPGDRPRDRRLPGAAGRGCGDAQRDRRDPAPSARHDRQAPAHLLRLDRGEPAQVPGPLHPVRRGRHRAAHPRGAAAGRAGPAAAARHPRRLSATFGRCVVAPQSAAEACRPPRCGSPLGAGTLASARQARPAPVWLHPPRACPPQGSRLSYRPPRLPPPAQRSPEPARRDGGASPRCGRGRS